MVLGREWTVWIRGRKRGKLTLSVRAESIYVGCWYYIDLLRHEVSLQSALRQLGYSMINIADSYEATRMSPTALWSRADGSRYVAYCIWTLRQGQTIDPEPIGGDLEGAKEALFWGWLRESSLALELILKSVLAQTKLDQESAPSVPSTHNVPQLWKMAGLPKTSWQQEYFLASAYQVLSWAGRYSAPRKGTHDLFENRESIRPRIKLGRGTTPAPVKMDWDSFDTLYQIAQNAYFLQFNETEVD